MAASADLSVVIPVYDSALTIGRALTSVGQVLAGNPRVKTETIVVFDGPDPDSEIILADRSRSYPLLIRTFRKPHGGVSSARNLGIVKSRAEFITFLDADDEITEARLALAELKAPRFLIGRQQVVFDTDGKAPAGISRDGKEQNHYFNSMVAPRKALIELGGFDENLALGQDVELAIRARDQGYPVDLVDALTTVRHVTGQNASLDIQGARRDLLKALAKNTQRSAVH